MNQQESHNEASLSFRPQECVDVVAHYGIEVGIRRSIGMVERLPINHHVKWLVGDQLIYDGHQFVVQPRRNILQRRAAGERGIQQVASNIDRVLIATTAEPPPRVGFIDRLLVMLDRQGIEAALLVTKADLPEVERYADTLRKIYATQYKVMTISVKHRNSMEMLIEEGQQFPRQILIGPSGVGKSSLTAELFPNDAVVIGALSEATGRGKHTTTFSAIYRDNSGVEFVDTPGCRDYGLANISRDDLRAGFHELTQLSPCRFRSCQHIKEAGCQFLQAVRDGHIDSNRHKIYCQLYDEVDRIERLKRRGRHG